MCAEVVRTRFAPSPSGHLHVGGARTALLCWAYAKGRGGTFILRIEDTDRKRTSDEATIGFLEDLAWLGIGWDEGPVRGEFGGGDAGPYFQSERLALYDREIERLISAGRAYRAFETAEELDRERDIARREKRNFRYDRAGQRLDPATVDSWVREGRPHVVRFLVEDDVEVVVDDMVLGEVRVRTVEMDDFVIRKADGFPTYHFAVVVDDEAMGVTHVIRAQEHLYNTPKHVLLQDALGFRRPVYAHLSLIQNQDGSKMSKRDKDKAVRRALAAGAERSVAEGIVGKREFDAWLADSEMQLPARELGAVAEALGVALPEIEVDDFRRAGYLPEVLINYLALLGWSPGGDLERFTVDELVARFDLDRVMKSPAKFDRDKLLAFNLDSIQSLAHETFARRYREHLERYHPEFIEKLSEVQLAQLAAANHPRAKTLDDTVASSRFFILDDSAIEYPDSKPLRKALASGDPCGYDHLASIREQLAALREWTVPALEAATTAYAAERAGGKLGQVAQPLRVAVSGSTVSPAIFDTLSILGRASVLRRIDRCLATRDVLTKTS